MIGRGYHELQPVACLDGPNDAWQGHGDVHRATVCRQVCDPRRSHRRARQHSLAVRAEVVKFGEQHGAFGQ